MGKLVLLKLGEGSLEQGFPVTLQLGEEGRRPVVETRGRLSAASDLHQAHQQWAIAYRNLSQRLRLETEAIQVSDARREDCHQAARVLAERLNHWLYADSFRPIREKLLEQLMPSDQVRVILQTENPEVRRLPWHLWDFCDRYPKTEIALGAAVYEQTAAERPVKSGVSMLAILGDSTGIDTQTDRRLLAQLPGAEVSFLVEPTRQALTQELWRQSWDILFFAGHSHSFTDGNGGQIILNQTDRLTLDQLKYALRRAVNRGLQIAIFNSCDGLGLARELEDLKIPQIVVMREPVPDQVAQEFLKAFLASFAEGELFHVAVRQARETLQGIEDQFPCATWLPVICQNPAVIPPTWQGLGGSSGRSSGGDLLTLSHPDFSTQPMSEWLPAPAPPVPPVHPSGSQAGSQAGSQPKSRPGSPPRDTSTASTLQPGLINDRYHIERMLGRGGFGRTYLASDTYRFGDLCVLKQFAPTNRAPAVLQRSRELFEREAKVLYQINHPQIPKFLAWFTQSDQLFIVEEYINGKTYLELLEERKQRGINFLEAEIIEWLKDLLPLLDYLHGINIIHRDISPGNVMLPHPGAKPVLIDFGVVKEVASQIWSQQTGSFQALPQASRVGKPGYSPREQMQFGHCYPSSDLYALGMTALVLLTGRNPQWLLEQRLIQPQWRTQVQISEPLWQVLDKMLSENPRDRYPTAQAVLAALQSFSPSAATTGNPAALATAPTIAPSIAPPPAAEPSLQPAFLQHCHQEFMRCVGPMADYILEDLLAQTPPLSAANLIELLTAEIPDAQQANQFRTQATAFLQQLSVKRQAEPPPIRSSLNPKRATAKGASQAAVPNPSPSSANDLAEANPAFLDCCRRELARQIGPMATYMIDDILTQSPHLTARQFVVLLAAEIPDARQAEAFKRQLFAQLP